MANRRTIPATEFKATCLALFDEVEATGEKICLTRQGKTIAELVPLSVERTIDRPSLVHLFLFIGDIESPLDGEWEAMN